MAVISGINGVVNGVANIKQWKIRQFSRPTPFMPSGSQNGVGRACGNQDWTGWYDAYGATPASFAGAALSFAGCFDASTDKGATGSAIVDKVTINWPIEEGGYIWHRVDFSSNGALTIGTSTCAADSTAPNPACSVARKVNFNDVDQVPTLRTRAIFMAHNRLYVDDGLVKRVAGNIDGTFDWDVYTSDTLANAPAINTSAVLKLYTTDTLFWEITNAVITAIDDLGPIVDPPQERVSVHRVFAEFSGINSGVVGSIKNPATTQVWPAAGT